MARSIISIGSIEMARPLPALIVFGGRPGTGKTTLSRELARKLAAAYLRIDTIEQNLKAAGFSVGAMGYTIANALAAENLRLDRVVIVDCVNPVSASRNGWRETALRSSARLVEIEIICSDEVEHRNRVEGRVVDIEGLMLPSWSEVINRPYEPWDRDRFVLDTATRSIDSLVDDLEAHVGHELAWRSRDV